MVDLCCRLCQVLARLWILCATFITHTPLYPLLSIVCPFRFVPIIAGSAVGRKASSRQGVKARGQFQTFDTTGGIVRNQARFQVLGQQGVINVDGPARVVSGDRIEAVFTEAEMRIGESLR
jgi:hypothetical protein